MNHIRHQNDISVHDHDYLEIAVIVSGHARHLTVRGVGECSAGDVISIPPGTWHGYSNCHNMELYNCLFSPSLLNRELIWLQEEPGISSLLRYGAVWQHEIGIWKLKQGNIQGAAHQLSDLEKTYKLHVDDPSYRLRVISSLLNVLSVLVQGQEMGSGNLHEDTSVYPPLVKRCLELINTDLRFPWTLGSISSRLNVHPGYLVRLFSKKMGKSPMKYLSERRGERAATLLLTTDSTISEIGDSVGWSDPKHFARSFHRQFGKSAREYRASSRQSHLI